MKYTLFITVIVSIFMPLLMLTSEQISAIQTKECTVCHVSHNGGLIRQPLTELCVTCHKERLQEGEHIVDIVPKYPVPRDLPLTKDGKLTCITCHDQHSRDPMMLRMETMILCNKCHKK
jgi:predicted CXXCH cytochrome family protein